jgi:hypothetical protein
MLSDARLAVKEDKGQGPRFIDRHAKLAPPITKEKTLELVWTLRLAATKVENVHELHLAIISYHPST